MRRSRFTATLIVPGQAAPVRRVCLAYSAEWVCDYFTRRGYIVRSVVKGDYRVKAARAKQRSEGGFRLTPDAVEDAMRLLGLRLPVVIRYNGRQGRTNGNYRFHGGHHEIMLKSYRTAAQASSTLWHELTHALQAERAGDKLAWNSVRAEYKGQYQTSPIEIEARRTSRLMADCPLAVPANTPASRLDSRVYKA